MKDSEYLRREGSRWRPAFIVAAACSDTDADRGDPVGDSARGSEGLSLLVAIVFLGVVYSLLWDEEVQLMWCCSVCLVCLV